MTYPLPPTVTHGLLNFPGATPEAKATVERLLETDRENHHCFFGVGLHNHLSHHLLAAYDLGAPAKLIQTIYDEEAKDLDSIFMADRKKKLVEKQHVGVTAQNWTEYLGEHKYYANYFKFFEGVVANFGASKAIEQYIFAPAANGNGTNMLQRFVDGAFHPLIQVGYGVEFGSAAMVAQGLAQTAVHSASAPQIFDLRPQEGSPVTPRGTGRQPSHGLSLLEIFRQYYDSETMRPVMPYNPDASFMQRIIAVGKNGGNDEIVRLSNLWRIDVARGQVEIDEKIEELIFLTTALLAGSGKPARKPRLDFFIMHFVTTSVFLPSLLNALSSMEHKALLLRAIIPPLLLYTTSRGRPRINPELLMSYSATPRPPSRGLGLATAPAHETSIGSLADTDATNPWPEIIASVLHAPDAHTIKTIRTLYYGAQKYGTTPPGGVIGAFRPNGTETHEGIAKMDGTIFVRAAGLVMDQLGWVTHGQQAGKWDFSGLGWEDAWKNEG